MAGRCPTQGDDVAFLCSPGVGDPYCLLSHNGIGGVGKGIESDIGLVHIGDVDVGVRVSATQGSDSI